MVNISQSIYEICVRTMMGKELESSGEQVEDGGESESKRLVSYAP